MPQLEQVAPNYARARNRWPTAPTLCGAHSALVATYAGNSHGIVEHVRSFIECICTTILDEFGATLSSETPTTTQLLVGALKVLGLENSKGTAKLDKVLSAYNKMTDALSEMRNDYGPVAHGKDAFLDAIAADHARAFLFTGDAILGVLLNAMEGKQPDLILTREPYESFGPLNARIDAAVGMDAEVDYVNERPIAVINLYAGDGRDPIELRLEASQLLYGVDRAAYVEMLRQADAIPALVVETVIHEQESVSVPAIDDVVRDEESLVHIVASYDGRLTGLSAAVEIILNNAGIAVEQQGSDQAALVASLLATIDDAMGIDWRERGVLQAKARVGIRRVLKQFGVGAAEAGPVSDALMGLVKEREPVNIEAQ